jgi:Lrp/AsnC family transcriptional regulator for asnA, asnC and gidA
MSIGIDSLDQRIIDLLMQDARQSSIDLAKQLDVDASTVRRRMKKLLDEEIIHVVALPEPERVGLTAEAVIALDVTQEHIKSALQLLRDNTRVRWAAATSGRYDVMAYVWCYSINDLYQFIENELSKIEGIRNSETFICMQVEKHP